MGKRNNNNPINKSLVKKAMIFLLCIAFATFLKGIELKKRNSKRVYEKRLNCIEQLVKEKYEKSQKVK